MHKQFVSLLQPNAQQVQPPAAPNVSSDDDGKKRKQCFAILAKLKQRFVNAGISENAFWCWALAQRDISFLGSRMAMSTLDWTILAARLHTAQRHAAMFDALCEQIHKQGNCRVYRINADLSEQKVFDGLFEKSVYDRAGRHANATGCVVRVHAYNVVETFNPKDLKLDPNTPPIAPKARSTYRD